MAAQPKLVGYGALLQFSIMPFMGFLVSRVASLPSAAAVGCAGAAEQSLFVFATCSMCCLQDLSCCVLSRCALLHSTQLLLLQSHLCCQTLAEPVFCRRRGQQRGVLPGKR